MARSKGSANFAGSLEVLAGAPLDARATVPLKTDLTAAATFPYFYEGMKVYVAEEKKTYTLTGSDPTLLANWTEDGSGGGSSGHTIIDGAGESMTSREGLQFVGATVTDDSTNDKTIVDVSGKADLTVLAAEFDDTANYAEGDRVTYNGGLYRFTAAHTGAWDAGDVTAVNVDGEIPDALTSAQMDAIKGAFTPNMGAPLRAMNFSTDEQIVGTWIDGKPLYQKTVNCGAIPNNTTKLVEHGISNIDVIISMSGFAFNSSHNGFPLPCSDNNSNYSVYIDKDGNYIRIATAADRSSLTSSYITMQYTKTTD